MYFLFVSRRREYLSKQGPFRIPSTWSSFCFHCRLVHEKLFFVCLKSSIMHECCRRGKVEGGRGGRLANGYRMAGRGAMGARRGARRDISGQMVIDHDEDNLSDKETYSKNIPAIGE